MKERDDFSMASIHGFRGNRALCLAALGRHLEAMNEMQECEEELPSNPASYQEIQHAIDILSRSARIAMMVGLERIASQKALKGLALVRSLDEHDDAQLLKLLQSAGLDSVGFESRCLLELESSMLCDRGTERSLSSSLLGERFLVGIAKRQGRVRDAQQINRRILKRILAVPLAERSPQLRLSEWSCRLELGEYETATSLLRELSSGDLRPLLLGATFRSGLATKYLDSGRRAEAVGFLTQAMRKQADDLVQGRGRAIAPNDDRRTVSQVAAVIYAGTREMDGQVAGSYWIDSSMAAIRLLAQSRAIRKAGRRSKSDGEAESPTAVAMNDEIASCLLPQIQAKLLQTDVLVHYGHYVPRDDVNRLCQFVVTRNAVTRHELGRVWDVAVAAQAFRAKLKTGQSDFEAAKELGLRLGIPNLKLDQRKRLLISESINTASVPFAALVDLGGKRVVEKASVTQVSAMSALVNLRSSVNSARRVLLVGDVDFASPRDGWHFRTRWPALPATKTEIEDIRASTGGRPVTVLRGLDATKPKAVEAARHCRTIHFATHASVVAKEYSPFDPPVDPLRLSGIVLSGANAIGPAAILTGSEVCMLDLSETRLVVLAGCETSRGSQYADKSIASLRQAFHVAGARSVVSSLWKVDDASTAAFMKLLYHYMWAEDMQPEAAFRQAQVTLFRSPQLIPSLARARGPDFKKVLSRPANTELKARSETQTRLWAAFQFSGAAGR
jgi:CHAT domain-containing protein